TADFDDAALLAEERSHTYLGCDFLKRLSVLIAGPCFNLLCAIVIVFSVLAFIGVDVVSASSRVGSLVEGSLAESSGILPGDEIIRIGDTPVSSWDDLTEPIQQCLAENEDFEVEVIRDGEALVIDVRISGSSDHEALGVYPVVEKYRIPPLEALGYAVSYAGEVAMYVVRLIDPSHTIEVLDQSSSVVGIANAASQAAQNGPAELLMLVASVSMSLCFMNLLPIPPLDGGKILLEIIELIRKKPLSKRAQAIVSYVGLAFFLFVFIYVLRLDILRIFTG
ncbi:MAG: site-2 protease family protein, partial [Atopobiaceae bacterium]|nr:site-2 protease family protein [Atopobiaceae bacterium]